jgi:hypothetical protein
MFGSRGPAERLIRSVSEQAAGGDGGGVGHRDIELRSFAE